MKIINLSIPKTQNQLNHEKNKQIVYNPIRLSSIDYDIVSFSAKPKKEKQPPHPNANNQSNKKSAFEQSCLHGKKNSNKLRKKIKNSAQAFSPKLAQQRKEEKQRLKEEVELRLVEEKIEYEHKKAEIRKKYITPSIQVRIKEQIISDKELDFIINKIKKYPELINELFIEPENGDVLLKLSDKSFQNIFENYSDYERLIKLFESRDKNNKIFMEKINDSKLAILNDTLKKMPTVLISAYLIPNKDNQLPAHYVSLNGLKMMNESIKDYPAILAQIYTHTDNIGNTPMHNRFRKGQELIKQALIYQPETISRIRRIRNKYDEYPETILKKIEKYSGPYEETWKIILNEF